jgi:uncharacterized membrane protein YozB (DUF420 family)
MLLTKEFYRSIMFGGTDSILTLFNLLIGLTIAKVRSKTILMVLLITVVGNALADGISMYSSLGDSDDSALKIRSSLLTFLSYMMFGTIITLLYIIIENEANFIHVFAIGAVAIFLLTFVNYKLLNHKTSTLYMTPAIGIIGMILTGVVGYLEHMFG